MNFNLNFSLQQHFNQNVLYDQQPTVSLCKEIAQEKQINFQQRVTKFQSLEIIYLY